MQLTYETLNELMGFDISDDSFFSEGTVILLDGSAWELVAVVGCDLLFKPSDDTDTAQENNYFFYKRA